MSRLSQLRSKLFAHKLTSSINDNTEQGHTISKYSAIDDLLTHTRLGYDTELSKISGDRIDQRRSAQLGSIIYRQGVLGNPRVILICDSISNRSFHPHLLSQINAIILYIFASCDQLGLECIIVYVQSGSIHEYPVESTQDAIATINQWMLVASQYEYGSHLGGLLSYYHAQYYEDHAIVLSDRYTWDRDEDTHRTTHAIAHGQMVGYVRDYSSPTLIRNQLPDGLIKLKSSSQYVG